MKNIFASCLILCASVVWASDFKEGLVDYNKGNFVVAITKFVKAANEGQVDAQYILGMMYSLGIGAAINYAESQKWLLLAANQNFAGAQYNLGVMYEYGHGVAQDYAESAKWYLLAANQGDSNAQFNMAVMYANGMGVEKSLVEAAKMYKFAALQGDEGAQYNLGMMYAYGEGVEKNNITAFKWLSLAVNGSSEEFLQEALEAQDELAPQMNSKLINQAEDMAILCLKTRYKQCD